MSEALTVRESSVQLGTLSANNPNDLLASASAIATPLAEMIERQGLANSIQGKNYVRCEGWTTMGAMLGIIPREVSNIQGEDGVYTATVELVNMKTGAIVGRASAECGAPDETSWANRPRYAKRSMAATRATSKAFRLSFSWIMTLAGYEATPAEEIPDGGFHAPTQVAAPKATQPDLNSEDFGEFVLSFGKYKGQSITKVDNSYLHWLIEKTEEELQDQSKRQYKSRNEARMRQLLREKQRRSASEIEAQIVDDDLPFGD